MGNPISGLIFTCRSADKTQKGDIGRAPVTVGQFSNLCSEIAKFDNAIGAGAKSASSVFCELAKENKAFEYIGKGVKFASNNVNPLICASSVLKVATSDDKTKTAIVETGALSGMFLGEGLMKIHLDDFINDKTIHKQLTNIQNKGIFKTLADKILKSKAEGKIATILKGLIFVAGSIASYNVGQYISEDFANKVTCNAGLKKIDQKA